MPLRITARSRFPLPEDAPYNDSYGILVWNLDIGTQNVSSAVTILPNLFSNVALPFVEPSSDTATSVGFDAGEYLYLSGGIDDTKTPLNPSNSFGPLYRWFVCQTYGGYLYTTLAWVVGPQSPQNPSCVGVSVQRVYVNPA